jgi:hypothetical protein
MKHIKLFENYLFEAANAEILESPNVVNGVDTEEYLTKVKAEEANDRDKKSEYFAACKQFASSFAGKSMKVPNYGMIPKSTFRFEGFADCCFSVLGNVGHFCFLQLMGQLHLFRLICVNHSHEHSRHHWTLIYLVP